MKIIINRHRNIFKFILCIWNNKFSYTAIILKLMCYLTLIFKLVLLFGFGIILPLACYVGSFVMLISRMFYDYYMYNQMILWDYPSPYIIELFQKHPTCLYDYEKKRIEKYKKYLKI